MSLHFKSFMLLSGTFIVVFYYLNTLLLIPFFLLQKKWLKYCLLIAASFIIFSTVPKFIANAIETPKFGNGYFKPSIEPKFDKIEVPLDSSVKPINKTSKKSNFRKGRNRFTFFPGSYVIFFLVFAIGTCITVIQQWLKSEATKKEVETEKLNTELSFLKSQINPHFFFNTLNNIYSLAVVESQQTAPSILKLSAIMRYILSDAQSNVVTLEQEIVFIQNYIDLQMVRLTEKVKVNFLVEGMANNKMIAPLLFISFVENAFKYGVSTKENSSIDIQLKCIDNQLTFTANNHIVTSENNIQETTGIGINNVKRRLALLYPNKHELNIENQQSTYSVTLHIEL